MVYCKNHALRQHFANEEYTELIAMYEYDNHIHSDYGDNELYEIGVSYFKLGKYEDCLLICNNISLSFKDDNFFINEIIGESLMKVNRLKEAFHYFLKAINLKPELVSAKYKLMVLKIRLGIYVDKMEIDECFEKALYLKNINFLRKISYIYYAKGFFEEANYCIRSIYNIKCTSFDLN